MVSGGNNDTDPNTRQSWQVMPDPDLLFKDIPTLADWPNDPAYASTGRRVESKDLAGEDFILAAELDEHECLPYRTPLTLK